MPRTKQPVIHLRPWRQSRGMSQVELAEVTGITVANLSRLENHVYGPKMGTLRALAQALGISTSQLFTVPEGFEAITEQAQTNQGSM
jgi:transcriptional regulator with XRE-family HTH domain